MDLTVGSGWPYGGPQVAVSQAAGKLRIERAVVPAGAGHAPVPDIRSGERVMAAFLAPAAPATTTNELREVSAIDDGRLVLPDRSPQAREVLFFVSSRSCMMVKRPAVGAEGFVLNHYDRAAVDHYLRVVGDRLLRRRDCRRIPWPYPAGRRRAGARPFCRGCEGTPCSVNARRSFSRLSVRVSWQGASDAPYVAERTTASPKGAVSTISPLASPLGTSLVLYVATYGV